MTGGIRWLGFVGVLHNHDTSIMFMNFRAHQSRSSLLYHGFFDLQIFDSRTAACGPLGSFLFRRPLLAVTADSAVTSLAVSDDAGDIFRLPIITDVSMISRVLGRLDLASQCDVVESGAK